MQLDAILRPTDRVLDFGAGRGEQILDTAVPYRRRLFNFKGRCAHVAGCDVDEAVLTNPFLDHAEVIRLGEPLPYENDSFDIIYSRYVFEHVEDPDFIANELKRILKPGGVIACLTPNKTGYISIAGRVVPNRLHVRALSRIQPKRKAIDVFPTFYRLNTARAVIRAFGQGVEVYPVYFSGEPGYYFGNATLYRIWKCIHKYLPAKMQPLLIIYIRKSSVPSSAGGSA